MDDVQLLMARAGARRVDGGEVYTRIMEMAMQMRMLFAYNEWANERVLETAGRVSDEQLRQAPSPETRPMFDILAHALGTQIYWLANWRGTSSEEPHPPTFERLRKEFDASHAALRGYAERLTDAECDREEQWWKQWGYDQRAAVGPMILQVINHGTQHRSEVALMLAMLGHSTGDLDYLVWLSEHHPSQG